jgi:LPXTG-motif cell wall-anchored protein
MRKVALLVAGPAIAAAISFGAAHADDGQYPPTSNTQETSTTSGDTSTTIRDQGGPTTTAATKSTDPTTTKLAALPTTGSDSSSPLQMGGVALLAGIGMVSVASVRRRRPAAN